MSMFDGNEFRQKVFGSKYSESMRRSYGKAGGDFFPVLKPARLGNGTYLIRFLPPHPEKCEDGYLHLSTHSVQQALGGADRTSVECLARSGEDCAICDVLMDLAPYKRHLSSMVVEALDGMAPWSRVVFPATVFAKRVNPEDRKTMWKASKEEVGVILEVSVYGEKKGLAVDILNLFEAAPHMNDQKKGSYIQLSKAGNSYSLKVAKGGPLQNEALIKSYPNLPRFYFDGKYPIKQMTYAQQERLLEACWWYREPDVQEVFKKIEDAGDRDREEMQVGGVAKSPVPEFDLDLPY